MTMAQMIEKCVPDDSAALSVLAPAVGAVSLAAVGIAAAKACCGVRLRDVDPNRVIPTGMAVLTAGVAAYSYLSSSTNHTDIAGLRKSRK